MNTQAKAPQSGALSELKSPGQLAYEEDVRRKPCYWTGEPRKEWDELPTHAQQSWHDEPTPREYKNKCPECGMAISGKWHFCPPSSSDSGASR